MNAFLRKSPGIVMYLVIHSSACFSQINWSKIELGLTGGVFIYQGDLTPSSVGSYRTPGWNANLFVNRIINSKLKVRINFAAGNLHGDDAAYSKPAWRQQRNFNFHSPVWELSVLALQNVLQKGKFNAYVFGGAGISKLNVSRSWSNFNAEYFTTEPALQQNIATDAAHAPPTIIAVVPVGAGADYALNDKLSVVLETAYRFTATDYIDGFSKAANPDRLDHYHSHSLGVKYRFGKRSGVDCPVVRY